MKGCLVKTIARGEFSPGVHSFTWDATDKKGLPVSTGVYMYRLVSGDKILVKRIILSK